VDRSSLSSHDGAGRSQRITRGMRTDVLHTVYSFPGPQTTLHYVSWLCCVDFISLFWGYFVFFFANQSLCPFFNLIFRRDGCLETNIGGTMASLRLLPLVSLTPPPFSFRRLLTPSLAQENCFEILSIPNHTLKRAEAR